MQREFSPISCQVPNANEIVCKDCVHRDKTKIEIDNKIKYVGITKGNCDIFVYPDSKPSDVLFNNADCDFYEEE